jgi:pilus assembly protein Flp/PilA
MLTRFVFEEDGQTLIEYGLLLSLIALVVVTMITLLGSKVRDFYGGAGNKLPAPP